MNDSGTKITYTRRDVLQNLRKKLYACRVYYTSGVSYIGTQSPVEKLIH